MTAQMVIENATVVTSGGRVRANVYVSDGRIAAVTPERLPAAERVDAEGLLLMPGMVDAHVHLMDPGDPSREDFPTGTAAAARAGVTTVIEHTHARPVLTVDDLDDKRRYLADRSRVDFALAAHFFPERLDEITALWREGVAYFKAFTCTTHGASPASRRVSCGACSSALRPSTGSAWCIARTTRSPSRPSVRCVPRAASTVR